MRVSFFMSVFIGCAIALSTLGSSNAEPLSEEARRKELNAVAGHIRRSSERLREIGSPAEPYVATNPRSQVRLSWRGIPGKPPRTVVQLFDPSLGGDIERVVETGQVLSFRRVGEGVPSTEENKRETAERFLKEHHRRFLLPHDLSDLEFRLFTGKESHELVYTQRSNGHPVFGGEFRISVWNGLVQTVGNRLEPILHRVPLEIAGDRERAIAIAKGAVAEGLELESPGEVTPLGESFATLGVVVEGGIPIPVWRIKLTTTNPPSDPEVDVRADTQSVYSIRDAYSRNRPHG